ncbi:phage tail protein [Pseudomonas sp. NA-150]|uniref:phage tail protein n=1 Tax=Pseudomonas sp. NA-150 TaxID=3367525 RepID=UPI0037CA6ABF
MINRNSKFFAILTAIGEAKLANATALGIPWLITEMGVGDANNTDPVPDRLQTALINEQRRAPLNQLRGDPANPGLLIAEQVLPANVGGWWVRELGLYDADGDLVAVCNCAPSYKPLLEQGSGRTQIVRMVFIVSSTANVVLKIDPSIVLATREYVDLKVLKEVNKQDFKNSVRVATIADIALAGLQTVDDVALVEDDRVLVKDQKLPEENGLYIVSSGAWVRTQDADSSLEVTAGLCVPVEIGSVNGGSLWQLVTGGTITLGTTGLSFGRVSGRTGVAPGTYNRLTVDARGQVLAGESIDSVDGYGLGSELALPIQMLPLPTVASADGRIPVSAVALAKQGGQVSIEAGTVIGIGQTVGSDLLARLRNFTTAKWTSPQLDANSEYYLRAQVTKGTLRIYTQKGSLFDPTPATYKGTQGGVSGGGFASTPVDICIAQVKTGALGTTAQVRLDYNLVRPSWTKNLNGNGVIYLPLDPHARGARMVASNIVPASGGLITSVGFSSFEWLGGNYTLMTPGAASVSGYAGGWANPTAVQVFTNDTINDITVTTLTASFDHTVHRSLWQSYQVEHTYGSTEAIRDELLSSMGMKSHSQTDYDTGIALNFTDAVNVHVTWELIR